MATEKETVRTLCKSIITRLENQKSIAFPPRLRQIIQDELFGLVGPYIFTEEDVREKTLAKIGAKAEALQSTGLAESDQYRAAKAIVKASFGDDELNGFYFQKPLIHVAQTISSYFMRSSHIDEVYETDEDMEQKIVEIVKRFDPSQPHAT